MGIGPEVLEISKNRGNCCSDLRRLYTLLKRMKKGLPTMTDCISRYLRRKGEFLVSEGGDGEAGTPKNPIVYIQVSSCEENIFMFTGTWFIVMVH